jgi:hypothetical protein
MTSSASKGMTKVKTTMLITFEEAMGAMKKASRVKL